MLPPLLGEGAGLDGATEGGMALSCDVKRSKQWRRMLF